MGPRAGIDLFEKKIVPMPRIEPQILQPVAQKLHRLSNNSSQIYCNSSLSHTGFPDNVLLQLFIFHLGTQSYSSSCYTSCLCHVCFCHVIKSSLFYVTMSSQNFLFQYGCQAHTHLPSSVQTPRHLTAAHAWADSIVTLHFWFSRDLAVGHEFSLHTDKNLDKNFEDTDNSFEICMTFHLMDTFRHHCGHTDIEYSEDGGNIFFRNTGNRLSEYTECNPRRPKTLKPQTQLSRERSICEISIVFVIAHINTILPYFWLQRTWKRLSNWRSFPPTLLLLRRSLSAQCCIN